MNILILAPDTDEHASSVILELKRRGHKVMQVEGGNFPRKDQLSIRLSSNRSGLVIRQSDDLVDLSNFDTIWRRRGEKPVIDNSNIHSDDQDFAQNEARAAAIGLRDISDFGTARWVNPRAAADQIENKPFQLRLAQSLGIPIPDTLISNDPVEISEFYNHHNMRVIYKPLTPPKFEEAGETLITFVNMLPKDVAEDADLLKLTPGIYQPYLDKIFEIRVNVFDKQILSTRIDNQDVEGAEIDWRSKVVSTRLTSFQLPEWLEKRILIFMEKAGLVFGALDFVVRNNGDFVFLEVNQMGQFLWLDSLQDTSKHLNAMCDMLSMTA